MSKGTVRENLCAAGVDRSRRTSRTNVPIPNPKRWLAKSRVGEKHGFLTVLKRSLRTKSGKPAELPHWVCSCKCGRRTIVSGSNLQKNVIRSCGRASHNFGLDRSRKQRAAYRNKIINRVGEKHALLTIVGRTRKGKYWHWRCRCRCGGTITVLYHNLKTQNRRYRIRSCGCLRHRRGKDNPCYTSGSYSVYRREYMSYRSMVQRCTNPKNANYENYGGRGIEICARWREPMPKGFLNFLADKKKRPEGKSLDRENVMGNYEPNNCRWATKAMQANNRRVSYTEEELAKLAREAEAARVSEEELRPF